MNVSIIPDSITEGSKTFSGVLATRVPRVSLNPATTVITITDDEIGKCIDFSYADFTSYIIAIIL